MARPASLNCGGREEAWIEIIEEPKQLEHRFRYKCEGNGAGSILGESSTAGSVKTSPTIKIHNMKEKAVVVVSCVTKNEPYLPHPHGLVGVDCKNGVCVIQVRGNNVVKLVSVGIQCCKHQDAKRSLELRQEMKVDPFHTGHDLNVRQMDLNVVRLCFQVFLPGPNGKYTTVVKPVVTRDIVDKRSIKKLEICRLSRQSAFSCGGEELFILCDKATKGDVQVRFFGELPDGSEWEAFGGSPEVHKQFAVVCTTPRYSGQLLSRPASVWVQLLRPSDQMTGEPKPFQFIPNAPDDQSIVSAKRRKIEERGLNITSSSCTGSDGSIHMEESLLLPSQHHALGGSGGLDLMRVVGAEGHLKLPPPYLGPADSICSSAEVDRDTILNDLVDLFRAAASSQQQVNMDNCSSGVELASAPFINLVPTGPRVNPQPHASSQADGGTANQDGSIKVPTLNQEQANQRKRTSSEANINATDLNGCFVNVAPMTGQRANIDTTSTSDFGIGNDMDVLYMNDQADQRQNNLRFFTPNFPFTNCDLVSFSQQQGFNVIEAFSPNQTSYIVSTDAGGKSYNQFPAGTVLQVTQAPVEDDIPQDNY